MERIYFFKFIVVYSRIGVSVVTGFFTFLLMARIDLFATVIVLAIAVAIGCMNNIILKVIRENTKKSREKLGEITSDFTNGFDSADSVKIYGAVGFVMEKFNASRSLYNEVVMKTSKIEARRLSLYTIVNNLTLYGSMIFLSWRVLINANTMGNALAFIVLLMQALVSIEMIFRWSMSAARCDAAWERIKEIAVGLYITTNTKLYINDMLTPIENVSKLITFVPSEQFLFSGTLYDNLTLGEPLSKEQCLAKSVELGMDKWITSLPGVLDFTVEKNGDNLSGGQKQMISILRALLVNKPIVVMDEPYSALDTEWSEAVKQAVDRAAKEKLVIITTHR